MNVREMTAEDLEQVMEIETVCFSAPWTETGFFTYLLREDATFLVSEEQGEIFGYCGLITAADEGDITNVAVKKEKRGQGIGGALVQELIIRAEKAGVTSLYLEVRESNTTALALYGKLGFEQVGVRKHYYTDPTEDGITMSRKHSR